MLDHPSVRRHLQEHPHQLLFVTVSGAHLYGFASHDSDIDLRGCHVARARDVLSLSPPNETHEVMHKPPPGQGLEVDLVTHDFKKYATLLLKNNGYVLEQIFSPLVAFAAPEFEELKAIAADCVTRNHRHHFFHFASDQWKAVAKNGTPRVKGLLYTYRVLLAGIHLMQAGQVESNLQELNKQFRLPYIDELIQIKTSGSETGVVPAEDMTRHESEFLRLCTMLDEARDRSSLPEEARGRQALEDLLIRLRISSLNARRL